MGEQSVALARRGVIYFCGTVEFIVDGDKNFFFLEDEHNVSRWNTRDRTDHGAVVWLNR